jgi:hypothetical protein
MEGGARNCPVSTLKALPGIIPQEMALLLELCKQNPRDKSPG